MLAKPQSVLDAYSDKPAGYFSGARMAFVAALPANPSGRLLEIGCGNGATASYALAQQKCGHAVGVELCEGPAREAMTKLHEVVVGDVETLSLNWPSAFFDVLLLSEVLEHLRNPREVLVKLRTFLKPGAMVIAGSPNVAHHSVIRMLLRGRWDYAPSGVMDATHLRWFTPATYAQMFADAGFRVIKVAPAGTLGLKARCFNALTLGRLHHVLHTQIVLTALLDK